MTEIYCTFGPDVPDLQSSTEPEWAMDPNGNSAEGKDFLPDFLWIGGADGAVARIPLFGSP